MCEIKDVKELNILGEISVIIILIYSITVGRARTKKIMLPSPNTRILETENIIIGILTRQKLTRNKK